MSKKCKRGHVIEGKNLIYVGSNKQPICVECRRIRKLNQNVREGNILPPETPVTLQPYKDPLTPVTDGFGYMGTIAQTKDGSHIQCHICGYFFRRLYQHVKKIHDITTTDYKKEYGLLMKPGLVSPKSRQTVIDRLLNSTPEQKRAFIESAKKQQKRYKEEGYRHQSRAGQHASALEKKNLQGWCPDQILDKIEALSKKINHTPSAKRFEQEYGIGKIKMVLATYGTWNQALSFAGLTPTIHKSAHPRYTRDSVIAMMRTFYELEGRIPRGSDLGGKSILPDFSVLRSLFGGLVAAREAAGFGQNDYIHETGAEEESI